MELKKNPKYDLKRYVSTFFLAGFLIAELITLYAFTFTQYEEVVVEEATYDVQSDNEELPDITQQNEPPPPAPPPPPPTTVEVVEDDVETQDIDLDLPEDTEYQTTTYAAPPTPEPEPENTNENEVFEIVEKPAEFPGGDAARQAFIVKHLVYPPLAVENNKQGTVVLQFIVEKDGSLNDIKAVKSFDDDCAAEAIRVAKMMRWTPGEQRGRPVRVKVSMPVKFRLK
ncbi:MAG: energy transducer TonB [Bacteroidetes bacterium]|nr:MAG: energy transducer TonB [Bacteroidota bacterium]